MKGILRKETSGQDADKAEDVRLQTQRLKVYLFNDTSEAHAGCVAVMESLRRALRGHEIIATHKVGETRYDVEAMNVCDVVFVNGEGTIHHCSPGGNFLMQMLGLGQAMGKKTLLVNAVFQQEPPYYSRVLAALDFFAVREPFSRDNARLCGGNPEIRLDSCVGSDYNRGHVLCALNPIVKGDTHPASEVDGVLDRLPFQYFGLGRSFPDFIATVKQCRVYITGQHHAVYACGLAGVPFVPVPGNTHKIESLIAWSGLPIKVCKTPEEIMAGVRFALNHPEVFAEFQNFLLSQKPFDSSDLEAVLANTARSQDRDDSGRDFWQSDMLPSKGQPFVVAHYDETSTAHKLYGATAFFHNRVLLRTVLEEIDPEQEEVNVLFHAASIGCEPYSFAIAYDLFFKDGLRPKLTIHATDLSAEFVAQGKEALYPLEVLNDMSREEQRYFDLYDAEKIHAGEYLRKTVQYLEPASYVDFSTDKQYDIVFVMNSLLYVSAQDQAKTLDHIARYNTGLLIITGSHLNHLRADMARNGYEPMTRNLRAIYEGWHGRLALAQGCISQGITRYTPSLEPMRSRPDREYRYCSIFRKSQGTRATCGADSAPGRLRKIIASSEPGAFQRTGQDVQGDTGKGPAFILRVADNDVVEQLAQIEEFIASSPERMLITTTVAMAGMGALAQLFRNQILFADALIARTEKAADYSELLPRILGDAGGAQVLDARMVMQYEARVDAFLNNPMSWDPRWLRDDCCGWRLAFYDSVFYGFGPDAGEIDIVELTQEKLDALRAGRQCETARCLEELRELISVKSRPSVTVEVSDAPVIIAEDYKGFVIFAYDMQYWAVVRGLVGVDFSELAQEELEDYTERGLFLTAETYPEVRTAVDCASLGQTGGSVQALTKIGELPIGFPPRR